MAKAVTVIRTILHAVQGEIPLRDIPTRIAALVRALRPSATETIADAHGIQSRNA